MKLWLDDERDPIDYVQSNDWLWVTNTKDCIAILKGGNTEELSLDHDLGEYKDGKEFTGYDVCMFLVEEYQSNGNNYFPPKVYVHTANPVAGNKMVELLNRYKPDNVQVIRVNLCHDRLWYL